MGLHWVINMGVPVLIGVCQQASGGGGATSVFGINTWTTATVTYGASNATAQEVPKAQAVTSNMNAGNSFTIPDDGVFFNYSFGTPVRVNHGLQVTFDTFGIVESELPADGANQITFEFQAQEVTSGFQVIDMNSGDPINEEPNELVTLVYQGLTRSMIMGEGLGFSTFDMANPEALGRSPFLRFALFDDTNINFNMKILMADGTEISATNPPTIIQTETSCKNVLV